MTDLRASLRRAAIVPIPNRKAITMFKDQYPATWRAAVAYRREKERREEIKRSLLEATGWTPPEAPATASETAPDAPEDDATGPAPSARLSITVPEAAAVSIRIDRDGGALTATVALDGFLPSCDAGGRA